MKCLHIDITDLPKAIDWLKTKPDEELKLVIYSEDVEAVMPKLMASITKAGRSQVEWIVGKIQSKQLTVEARHGTFAGM